MDIKRCNEVLLVVFPLSFGQCDESRVSLLPALHKVPARRFQELVLLRFQSWIRAILTVARSACLKQLRTCHKTAGWLYATLLFHHYDI